MREFYVRPTQRTTPLSVTGLREKLQQLEDMGYGDKTVFIMDTKKQWPVCIQEIDIKDKEVQGGMHVIIG